MSFQHLQIMGIETWQLKPKPQLGTIVLFNHENTLSKAGANLLQSILTLLGLKKVYRTETFKQNHVHLDYLIVLGKKTLESMPASMLENLGDKVIVTHDPEHLLNYPRDKRKVYRDLALSSPHAFTTQV